MALAANVTKVTRNGQITLPAAVRRAANIEEGDYIEVTVEKERVILTAVRLIEKSQAYFWAKEWQEGERQAEEDKKAGRSVTFESAQEAVEFLRAREHSENRVSP